MQQQHYEVITMPGYPSQPTLWTLMLRHGIQLLDLAKASHQDPLILWCMLVDHPVRAEQAIQVLGTLNEIFGTNYGLKSIALNLGADRGQEERY